MVREEDEMSKLVEELKEANRRGVCPPQNWTHRAIEEIENLGKGTAKLKEANASLRKTVFQFADQRNSAEKLSCYKIGCECRITKKDLT